MNKRVLVFGLLIILGLSFVYAARMQAEIGLTKNWNLVYGFTASSVSESELENIKAIYAFIPTTQEYVRVYPEPEISKINSIGESYLWKSAVWVYYDKKYEGVTTKYNVEEPPALEEMQLYRRWNFVGVTPKFDKDENGVFKWNEVKGNCDILKINYYNTDLNEWSEVSLSSEIGINDALWRGFVILVSNDCKLGVSSEAISSPPAIPA